MVRIVAFCCLVCVVSFAQSGQHGGEDEKTKPPRQIAPTTIKDRVEEAAKRASDHLQMQVRLNYGVEPDSAALEALNALLELPAAKEESLSGILYVSTEAIKVKTIMNIAHVKLGSTAKEIKPIVDSVLPDQIFKPRKQASRDRLHRINKLVNIDNFTAWRDEYVTLKEWDELDATLDRIEKMIRLGWRPPKDVLQMGVFSKANDALAPTGPENISFQSTNRFVENPSTGKFESTNGRVMSVFFPITDKELKKHFSK